jgi:hypothetical protein
MLRDQQTKCQCCADYHGVIYSKSQTYEAMVEYYGLRQKARQGGLVVPMETMPLSSNYAKFDHLADEFCGKPAPGKCTESP